MKNNFFANLFGGQILLVRGGLIRHWKFVIYVFFLIILYISIHFGVRDTIHTITKNEDVIKSLKAEYIGKNAKLLFMSKRGEIEQRLQEENSTLVAPSSPPVRIILDGNVR